MTPFGTATSGNTHLRLFAAGLVTTTLAAGAVFAWRDRYVQYSAVDSLEFWTLDVRFRARGADPVGSDVVLLAFDDRTLEERPDLFERRAGMAKVIRAASAAGAKVIGVDLLFADREQLLAKELVADIDTRLATADPASAPVDVALLTRVADESHGDQELADAIRDAGNVVLGMHVGFRGAEPDRSIAKAKYGQVAPGPYLPPASDKVMVSDALFVKASSRMGLISVFEDANGAVRDVQLGAALGQSVIVPFAFALIAEYKGIDRANVAYLGEEGSAHLGDLVVQGVNGSMLLDWRGTPFTTVSVVDLVDGTAPPDALKDKIAILGFTHLAEDTVDSPFGRQPGFMVHATAIDQVLSGDRLTRATPAIDALVTWLAGLLVASLFIPKVSPAMQVGLAAMVVCLAGFGVYEAFASAHLWMTGIGPVFAAAATASVCLAGSYWLEGLQRRHLRHAFSHYLSDELVDELVADPSRLSLSGERRELSVLFTDIRNFTTFSERIAPLELASFLRHYLDPMTKAVLVHDGYVDKFIGDAVMAIFGAPVLRADHAVRACASAIEMFKALDLVRPEASRLGIDLHIGAGVNTGDMVVGNIGSAERFDYTVLGDAVNLGSRLESLTKTYGVFCLVGPKTADHAKDACKFRVVDLVRVKGKHEPIELFELLSGPGGTIVAYADVEQFRAAMAAWRAGDMVAAKGAFEDFLAKNPTDSVTKLYLERLAELGGNAPAGWDGVYTHTKK